MGDTYHPHPERAYLLYVPFSMPSDGGEKWAISLPSNSSMLLAAALSLAVTFAFVDLWNLIFFTAISLCNNRKSPRRYAALVAISTTKWPWAAVTELARFTWSCGMDTWSCGISSGSSASGKGDLLFGVAFCVLAFCIASTSMVMSIITPSLMNIGHVAPVQPGAVYWPRAPITKTDEMREFAIRAPAFLRALGSVEALGAVPRSKVFIKPGNRTLEYQYDNIVSSFEYRYHISGIDLGLQRGADLALEVQGFCATEYGWNIEENPTNPGYEFDLYDLWEDPDRMAGFSVNNIAAEHITTNGPKAFFFLNPDSDLQWQTDSNVSYAAIINSAHLPSYTSAGDPWYLTEATDESLSAIPYRVRRRRPALSCWEKNQWSYGDHEVASVSDLESIPGISIPHVLLDILKAAFSGRPMIYNLAASIGGSAALKSQAIGSDGIISAQNCKMFEDMERLILASFIATRNIFTDAAATRNLTNRNFENIARGTDGLPREGAGKFVLPVPTVQTFSLTGIIALVGTFIILMLANAVTWVVVGLRQGITTRRTSTAKEKSV